MGRIPIKGLSKETTSVIAVRVPKGVRKALFILALEESNRRKEELHVPDLIREAIQEKYGDILEASK